MYFLLFVLVFAMNSAYADLSVLVVGAGPAGLTVAKALQNNGIYPDIIEKEDSIRAVGAGMAIPSNGSWALEKLGIPVSTYARSIAKMQFTDEQGNLLIEEEISKIHPDGAGFYSISRDALQKMLIASLDAATTIRTGTEIIGYSENQGKVEVRFSDNKLKSYDFVIGCDGIRSSVRQIAYPQETPEYLGLLVWRTMIDNAPAGFDTPVYMLGSDRTALLYPLPDNKMYVYGQIFQTERQNTTTTFPELFQSFGGYVPEVLKKLGNVDFYIHQMEKSHSVRFTLDGYSRILLVGDASHAFGPMLQNGAAQVFEDAYVLQQLFNGSVTKDEIPAIIDAFVKRREARVQKISASSNAKIQAISDPKIVASRNEMIRTTGAPNVKAFKVFMQENP